jgi:hypothetical protein
MNVLNAKLVHDDNFIENVFVFKIDIPTKYKMQSIPTNIKCKCTHSRFSSIKFRESKPGDLYSNWIIQNHKEHEVAKVFGAKMRNCYH